MSKINSDVIQQAIKSTNDTDFLHSLSDHPDHDIVRALLDNPSLQAGTIHKIYRNPPLSDRESLISSHTVRSCDILNKILNHPNTHSDTMSSIWSGMTKHSPQLLTPQSRFYFDRLEPRGPATGNFAVKYKASNIPSHRMFSILAHPNTPQNIKDEVHKALNYIGHSDDYISHFNQMANFTPKLLNSLKPSTRPSSRRIYDPNQASGSIYSLNNDLGSHRISWEGSLPEGFFIRSLTPRRIEHYNADRRASVITTIPYVAHRVVYGHRDRSNSRLFGRPWSGEGNLLSHIRNDVYGSYINMEMSDDNDMV